jgi:hypothetical protein
MEGRPWPDLSSMAGMGAHLRGKRWGGGREDRGRGVHADWLGGGRGAC